ncbi:hypothetical protein DBP15_08730 [Streptomyces sp. CS065A]|nr:hypothetical protein DBP15_08730 [Streptomyces sp. CS065A]
MRSGGRQGGCEAVAPCGGDRNDGTETGAPRTPDGAAAYTAWPTQPGPEGAARVMAGTAYVVGTALLALRGPHPDRDHARGWSS